jgi:uncharacterized protein (DUF362 family)
MRDVALVKTKDRTTGVRESIKVLGINPLRGKDVFIKPNFNTADPVPGSTDNETLVALVREIWAMGAKSIAVGDRSFPTTRKVMEQKGILPLLQKEDVRVIDFDGLENDDWILCKPKGSHWTNGFRVARPILEAECLVCTCCLKTHQYGGVFTLSLKLGVGVVPTTRNGHDYMSELHGSPHQQEMIAEINEPFTPDLIVLDGVEAFVDGGPATGKRGQGDVFLASTDRVATDAVGVAVLKTLGSNAAIMERKIFEQRQIARAVELGLGIRSPNEIELVSGDGESKAYAEKIKGILQAG